MGRAVVMAGRACALWLWARQLRCAMTGLVQMRGLQLGRGHLFTREPGGGKMKRDGWAACHDQGQRWCEGSRGRAVEGVPALRTGASRQGARSREPGLNDVPAGVGVCLDRWAWLGRPAPCRQQPLPPPPCALHPAFARTAAAWTAAASPLAMTPLPRSPEAAPTFAAPPPGAVTPGLASPPSPAAAVAGAAAAGDAGRGREAALANGAGVSPALTGAWAG